ncbi:hypothetical protein SDC9_135590 [bioreactor metagenome]|uniref:Uncharacterized protein n=1 Tax=bioreactor metagenome TaxID=1076179 RepID=A0A645DGL7_9ZZZZ
MFIKITEIKSNNNMPKMTPKSRKPPSLTLTATVPDEFKIKLAYERTPDIKIAGKNTNELINQFTTVFNKWISNNGTKYSF